MKLLSIVGARPQFVKLGPISGAISSQNAKHTDQLRIEHTVVHTGQHYDLQLSDVFFHEMSLPTPQVNLVVGSGSHGKQTGRMIEQLESVFAERSPDAVLVYGDTNSTIAAALAAAKLCIPVAHVEAGLRSFNKAMPEEINRVLTDHVSSILFCPTGQAVTNAQSEGFSNVLLDGLLIPMPGNDIQHSLSPSANNPLVLNVGDVMYDVYRSLAERSDAESSVIQRLDLKASDYALATIHRAENTDYPDRLCGIVEGLGALAADGLRIVFPAHPRTRKALFLLGEQIDCSALEIIEPVGYLDMLALERNATLILTDSGGVQKEAYFSGVPCVTLRDETEWVELVEVGWNRLAGAGPVRIREAVRNALAFDREIQVASLYGDAHASERIVYVLKEMWQRA